MGRHVFRLGGMWMGILFFDDLIGWLMGGFM